MEIEKIIETLRRCKDKDSKAYKVTKYYFDLTGGSLDVGGMAIVTSKIKSIEKELRAFYKESPKINPTIMSPEESALLLINDLRSKGLV